MSIQHHPSHIHHEVASPSSSPSGVENAHEMLHNVDAILAHEAHTLHRLQTFYEQHTFDTQGPYADLFALLLSSCKHVIDINAALVGHIREHDAALQRQRATCDVLCSAFARRNGHADATTASAMESASPQPSSCLGAREESEGMEAFGRQQRFGAHSSAPSVEANKSDYAPPPHGYGVRHEAAPAVDTSGRSDEATNTPQSAAWATALERRLDDVQEQLAALSALQHDPPPPPLPPAELSSNKNVEEKDDAAAVAAAALEVWKNTLEESLGERLDCLTDQVAVLERTTALHDCHLRWMGVGAGENAKDSTPSRPITRATSEPRASSGAAAGAREAPPQAVTRWLHEQLDQREEAWQRVLEEVQEALTTPTTPTFTPRNASLHGHLDTPTTNYAGPEVNPRQSMMARRIEQLLRTADNARLAASCEKIEERRQSTEEQLRDVVARLEVLEVYAPHRHAVASAPPVLGVELEDVTVPHARVRVRAVYHGYLADHAGVSVGDVIVGVGHHAILSRAQLYVVLAELTRDYTAQCRVKIEEGYMRHYTAAPGRAGDTSVFSNLETSFETGGADNWFDNALNRARAEATSAHHRSGSTAGLAFRGGSSSGAASAFAYPSSTGHTDLLAQCLPYFELTLHVLRDGRLRDVMLLVPPGEALRSVMQY